MNCEYCGAEIKKGQLFCPKCGFKIDVKEKKTNNKSSKGKKIIALICCIVLIVSGTIGGLYFRSKNNAIYDSDGNYIALESGFTDVKISDEASALKAIESVKDVIGITNTQTELKKDRIDKLNGTSLYRFNQYSDDHLVHGKSIVVIADNDGKALGLTANYNSDFEKKESRISIEDAENSIKKELEKTDSVYHITDEPIYYECNNKMYLCYVIYDSNGNQYFIDSTNQRVIERISSYSQAKADCRVGNEKFAGIKLDNDQFLLGDQDRHIFLFNAQNRPVYKENSDFTASMIVDSSTAMTSVDNVFGDEKDPFYSNDYHIGYNLLKNLIIVSDFYTNLNQRQNTACLAIINDSFNFNGVFDGSNAFGGYEYVKNIETKTALPYDDDRIISFSLGTQLCNDMENCIDTIGHEYTHGVTKSILEWGSLDGNNYPGALSEAYSDIMGELIEAKIKNQTPDWKHGDRNIAQPAANSSVHPYPASMNDFNNASTYKDKDGIVYYYNDDKNGVTDFNHFACEIISHCAYLMYNGIDGDNTKKIKPDQLANLWYYSLFILQSSPTFEQCRTALELSARIMLNNRELTLEQYNCVKEAFDMVGIEKTNYTYKSTVKNEFDLKVLNSKGTDDLTFNYKIYDFSDNSKRFVKFFDILKKDYEDFKIEEGTLTKGQKHISLSDGLYLIEINGTATNEQTEPIYCKIVVDDSNENSSNEVLIRTDFDEIITVVLNEKSVELPDIAVGQYVFSSGAGGWSTELKLNKDLSFSGVYHDSDFDHTTICEFTGSFSQIEKVDDYTYKLSGKSIAAKHEEGYTYNENGISYVCTDQPYGLEESDTFYLYLKGRESKDLSDEFLGWIYQGYPDNAKEIPLAKTCIKNEKLEYGFFKDDESNGSNDLKQIYLEFIENKKYDSFIDDWYGASPTEYSIIDIDQDGTDELIISGSQGFRAFYSFAVFGYDYQTDYVFCYSLNSFEEDSFVGQYYGSLRYSSDFKSLVYSETDDGMDNYLGFNSISGKEFNNEFRLTKETNLNSNKTTYLANDTEIDESMYNDFISKLSEIIMEQIPE